MDGIESQRSVMVKVGIFTVTMLLVALGLVVTFGEFRFGPSNTYHANFIDATRLKGNQKVRIAGVPVGAVKDVKLNREQHRGRGFHRGQALHVVLLDAGADPVRQPGGRPVPGNHFGPWRIAQAVAGRDDRPASHPARAGPRRATRWPASGAQRTGRRQDQHRQQLRDRSTAGPGRGAVQLAGQHQRIRLDARCARPRDRRA